MLMPRPLPPNQHRAPMPCTTHAPTHARPSLPVNQIPNPDPAVQAMLQLHDTAAAAAMVFLILELSSMKASFWGLLRLIFGNYLIFWELKFLGLIFRNNLYTFNLQLVFRSSELWIFLQLGKKEIGGREIKNTELERKKGEKKERKKMLYDP